MLLAIKLQKDPPAAQCPDWWWCFKQFMIFPTASKPTDSDITHGGIPCLAELCLSTEVKRTLPPTKNQSSKLQILKKNWHEILNDFFKYCGLLSSDFISCSYASLIVLWIYGLLAIYLDTIWNFIHKTLFASVLLQELRSDPRIP